MSKEIHRGRREALLALTDILEEGAYANLRLQSLDCAKEERAFVSALVYTALEHVRWADYMLGHYVKRQKRLVRNLLRLGVCELFFMDTAPYAAVNEWVQLCRDTGKAPSASLVNAVLRRMLREKDALPPLPEVPAERLSIVYGMPQWLMEEWIDRFGAEKAEDMLRPQPPMLEVRGQYPFTIEDLLSRFPEGKRGTLCSNCLLLPPGSLTPASPLFLEGKAVFQGEGAMAICEFMGDMRGKKVLDGCAAPGGKSAYLWSLFEGDIDLSCWELHPHRTVLMEETFRRLKVQAHCAQRDASLPYPEYKETFDGVLLDVPCSGLGLRLTKPDIGLHKEEEQVQSLVQIQASILQACCAYVKKGGVLVYSTCTLSRRENEGQVKEFLRTHPEFRLEEERQLLPPQDGLGGFYMARMRRCM